MLSVGRREDGRKALGSGLGLGEGDMEENEVEEGEACSGQEDDSFIDPDALSYIDERLQDVLGHLQKDFEGGVSAENLGAKFGGYGSFLPTYQRSPSCWAQPRSPPRQPSQVGVKSPLNSPFEGACQKPSVLASTSLFKNSTASTLPLLDNTCKKNTHSAGEPLPQHDSFNKPANVTDQKSLKVRIKVGTEIAPTRNMAAIYSGLGLDFSPSSPEDSPYGSEGLFPESQHSPDDTPMTILQIMTCFEVPGRYLLSPLAENLLHLTKKESVVLKHCKPGSANTGTQESFAVKTDLSAPARDAKGFAEKKRKSFEKNGKSMEVKNLDCKDHTSAILKREIDTETPAGQEVVSSVPNLLLVCSAKDVDEKGGSGKSGKGIIKTSGFSWEPNKTLMKERTFSPGSLKGNDLELTGNMEDSKVVKSASEHTLLKGKLNLQTSQVEKSLEERETTNFKDDPFDMARDAKVEKNHDTVKGVSDGFQGRKDQPVDPLKLKSAQKVTLYKEDGQRMVQEKDHIFEGNRKSKGSQINDAQLSELTKDNTSVLPSVALKTKKKGSHAKGDYSESKPKACKSHKGTFRMSSKETHRDVAGDFKFEQMDSRTDMIVSSKYKDTNLKNEESSTFTEKIKETLSSKRTDNPKNTELNGPKAALPTCNALATDAVLAPNAPVVIKENWVRCDKCQKWRLLPYETNTAFLPKKWFCVMQTWLPPGMNKCSITEEETTKALNAMYLIPAPESNAHLSGVHDVAASSIALTDGRHLDQNVEHNMPSVPAAGRKKNELKDASNVPNNASLTLLPNSAEKNQETSIKSRSLNDVNQCPAESNSLSDNGLAHTSETLDFTSEKYKHKQKKPKIRAHYSDEGDFIEQGRKQFKPVSKRDKDQDGSRASKKIKMEGLRHSHEDWNSDHDIVGKSAVNVDSTFSSKLSGKNSQKASSSKILNYESSGNLPASSKKTKGQVGVLPNGKSKEHLSSSCMEKSENLEFDAKKRKLKEWKDGRGEETLMSIQHLVDNSVEVKEALSESEPRKEKKAKVSKSEGKESSTSKADGRMEKKGRLSKIILTSSRECISDGMEEENRGFTEVHQLMQYHGNVTSGCALDGIGLLKKDIGYGQPSTAVTSSSSEVSCSRKRRDNFQETGGSPVESVSSSPMRIPSTEKFSTQRDSVGKDDGNGGFSIMESPKRYSEGEVDGQNDGSEARRKEKASAVQPRSLEKHGAVLPGVPDSLRVMCEYQDKEVNHVVKAKDVMHLKTLGGMRDDISPMEFEEKNLTDGAVSTLGQQNKYHCELAEKDHVHSQHKLNGYHLSNGSSQRKSGKSTSSRSRERHKSSKLDIDDSKLKVSESFVGKVELYCAKNASGNHHEADTNERSNYHKDLKNGSNTCQEKDEKNYFWKKDVVAKVSSEGRRDNHITRGGQKPIDANDPDLLRKQHKDHNFKGAIVGVSRPDVQGILMEFPSHEDKKSSHCLPDRIDQSELTLARGELQSALPSSDKRAQAQGPHSTAASVKGCKSAAYPMDAANGNASKVGTQLRKPDNRDGVHHSSMRHATPSGPDAPSPLRRDGHSAASGVLKDARDLKHTANRLKNEGLELESTGLYFQSALKFLHYAFLLEPPNVENARHAEANQSIQIYSDTAKLCEFVAHEYEKRRDMANAALAYKCVEVAYMKVAYFKHSSASKDRHELQTALQMLLPGESPSSSASDVDNLNNQGVLEKSASAKGANSPQIVGNHVVVARNRPNFVRLLNYTNETVCAFEASRKYQNAIALASVSKEKDGVGGVSSVKKVLDFNFFDVESLLQLVRLSMEAISR